MAHAGLPQVAYAAVDGARWARRARGRAGRAGARWACRCSSSRWRWARRWASRAPATRRSCAPRWTRRWRHDSRAIVEAAADGLELECSVIGNREPLASVPGEIVVDGEWYDYEAKYTPGGMELVIPARVPETVRERVRELAVEAFRADRLPRPGAGGLLRGGRRRAGQRAQHDAGVHARPACSASCSPPSGVPYEELLERLVGYALEHHEARAPAAPLMAEHAGLRGRGPAGRARGRGRARRAPGAAGGLHERGVSIEELRRAIDEERLVLLPVELVFADGTELTARQVAEQAGVDLDWLERAAPGAGAAAPRSRRASCSARRTWRRPRRTMAFREAGFSAEETLELSRRAGACDGAVAEAMRELVGGAFVQPGDTRTRPGAALRRGHARRVGDLGCRRLSATSPTGICSSRSAAPSSPAPSAAPGARAAGAQRRRGGLRRPGRVHPAGQRRSRSASWARSPGGWRRWRPRWPSRRCAWSRRSATRRCWSAPSRSRCWSDARPGGRRGRGGWRVPRAAGGDRARAGAEPRAGDWYGHTVNLASRVTGIARPGSVLTTEQVHDALAGRLPLVVRRRAPAEGDQGAGEAVPRAPGPGEERGLSGRRAITQRTGTSRTASPARRAAAR